MTIGERIKKLRTEKMNMSQVTFADKIDVSKQTLYKYENNIITNIPSDKVESIAKLCNVSPAYLMGWEVITSEKQNEELEFDDNVIRIARAHKQMSEKDRQRLMTIVTTSFEEYFSDDFEDDDKDE